MKPPSTTLLLLGRRAILEREEKRWKEENSIIPSKLGLHIVCFYKPKDFPNPNRTRIIILNLTLIFPRLIQLEKQTSKPMYTHILIRSHTYLDLNLIYHWISLLKIQNPVPWIHEGPNLHPRINPILVLESKPILDP